MDKNAIRYKTFKGEWVKDIPHWEHWSCPDAAAYITGIDYYESPRTCIEKLNSMYPKLEIKIPESDAPLPRPEEQADRGKGRWGAGYRTYWQQEDAASQFKTREDMLSFSPLEQADFTGWSVPESGDYSSEEAIYNRFMQQYHLSGDVAVPGDASLVSFYNTMFMWPLVVFGYENFLSICLEPGFARIMEEFAEINRRVFRALAKLPVNFIISHDDIVLSSGPVCSPRWMHKYIFPRYEEFWGLLKQTGKEVIFMVDGCVDAFVNDVMACGARGIISEPFTDYKKIAQHHKNCFIAGEGDNRILMRNQPAEIRGMVESMVETAKMSNGYMMCIGNHIPFNVPSEAIKLYLDISAELAYR